MDRRSQLGEFLRRRRESLPPGTASGTTQTRRRTPGLRREEVAELANISTVYYERLEQARGSLPSAPVLAGLAQALRLEADARDHLYRLAGHAPPVKPEEREIDPGLAYVLDAVADTTPASITDGLSDVLRQNYLSRELMGDVSGLAGWEANLTWRWFTSPAWRDLLEPRHQHEASGLAYAADLRAALGQRESDGRAAALVRDLLAASPEFGVVWDRHAVSALHCSAKVLHHPRAGRVDLECSVIMSPTSSQRLLLLQPTPGTPSAQRLASLVQLVRG